MRVSIICLLLANISGCSLMLETTAPQLVQQVVPAELDKTINSDPVHQLTQHLADQLYASLRVFNPGASIGVGTFTQIDTLGINETKNIPLELLGLQLEDGLMTASTQKGFRVIEYKLRKQLTLKPGQDLMLSRQLKDLNVKQRIDYFLTGTITLRNDSILVNARLVDVRSKEVVAAATEYVSATELWGQQKLHLKQGLIYRTSY